MLLSNAAKYSLIHRYLLLSMSKLKPEMKRKGFLVSKILSWSQRPVEVVKHSFQTAIIVARRFSSSPKILPLHSDVKQVRRIQSENQVIILKCKR